MTWYRVDSGFRVRGTAGDVVRYERDELGNVDLSVVAWLDTLPASRLTWVTRSKPLWVRMERQAKVQWR